MKAPETLLTKRLLLRKPVATDAAAIFQRYSSDSEVTRYLSWPTHQSIDDTQIFLASSNAEWERWPAGPYLIFDRERPEFLLGSSGLHFESETQAVTGYVFAKDVWGFGFATETLRAMVELAGRIGVESLEAYCHAHHRVSANVLEKCGFQRAEAVGSAVFPNLAPLEESGILSYIRRIKP